MIASIGKRCEGVKVEVIFVHRSRRTVTGFDKVPYVSTCPQVRCLIAAAGIHALNAPFIGIGGIEALRREAEEAAWPGFHGKAAIHPEQVRPILESFTPTSRELAEPRALVVAAWNDSGQPGTFAHAGQMVDAPHLARARRIPESA